MERQTLCEGMAEKIIRSAINLYAACKSQDAAEIRKHLIHTKEGIDLMIDLLDKKEK